LRKTYSMSENKKTKMSEKKLSSIYYSMYHNILTLKLLNVCNLSQSKVKKLK